VRGNVSCVHDADKPCTPYHHMMMPAHFVRHNAGAAGRKLEDELRDPKTVLEYFLPRSVL